MSATTLLVLVLGVLAGFGLGMLVAPPAPAPLQIPARTNPPVVAAAPSESPSPAASAGPALRTTPTPPAPSQEDPLPAAAEARAQQLASGFRERAQRDFDNAAAMARSCVRQELAKERATQEDLARGGTMAYLTGLRRDFSAPWIMLGSDDTFGPLFERKSRGRDIDGAGLDAKTQLADGDTVRYPAGRYALPVRQMIDGKPLAKDLLFVGAGMDETVLVLDTELQPRGDVHSLTFRDLTIHCNDNYLEQVRGGSYTLRLERCRVIGFDMGAGGADMLKGEVGAFFATDCRIESGYGRAPGGGNLFDVRGALLVRMVNCDIVGPFNSVYYQWSGAAHVFERCRFTRLTKSGRARLRRHKELVQFKDCTFEELSPEEEQASRSRKVRSITDINPAWR